MRLELNKIETEDNLVVAVLKPIITGKDASLLCDDLRKHLDNVGKNYQPVAYFRRISPLTAEIRLYFEAWGDYKGFSTGHPYPDELSALLPVLELLEKYNADQ